MVSDIIPIVLLGCAGCLPQCVAQSRALPVSDASLPDAPALRVEPQAPDQSLGTISGTVVDQNGSLLVSAHLTLARPGQPQAQEVVSDKEGQFVLMGVAPGPFELTITAQGFASQELPGTLRSGEALVIPQIELSIAAATTEVRIDLTRYDLAEEEVKTEELQRVFGVIPNFFVTYQPDALPLSSRQKFDLAWKTTLDPTTFVASGAIAGIEQAENIYGGYGQGAQGYAKRYAAAYGDAFFGIMIGSAVLPALLKQDPRYFYKGIGSTQTRIAYALANSVICKGDNGHWQANYSGILGSLASGGISNLYYPTSSRNGVGLTFQNTLVGIGGSAVANVFQEFVVRRLTPRAHTTP